MSVAVSNTSGLAGIAYWINNYYDLSDENKIDKKDNLVSEIKVWIDDEYNSGRQTVISDEELVEKINELSPGRFTER